MYKILKILKQNLINEIESIHTHRKTLLRLCTLKTSLWLTIERHGRRDHLLSIHLLLALEARFQTCHVGLPGLNFVICIKLKLRTEVSVEGNQELLEINELLGLHYKANGCLRASANIIYLGTCQSLSQVSIEPPLIDIVGSWVFQHLCSSVIFSLECINLFCTLLILKKIRKMAPTYRVELEQSKDDSSLDVTFIPTHK